ncbi:MAG: TraB/GumN family protein, partial [Alphaproteobacteria bacterium]|nr:TraB/GumN family protein [Alphaproteobacteria bacterium]
MRKNIVLSLVFALFLCTSAHAKATLLTSKGQEQVAQSGCSSREAGYVPIEKRYESGIIFRIASCDTQPSFIMGTMHHDDPSFAALIADAKTYISATDSAGFEFVEDERSQQVALQYMMMLPTDTRSIDSIVTPDEFTILTKTIESRTKIPAPIVNRMRPWAAALLLQYPAPKSDGIALDTRLQQFAASQKRTLYGLETPEEQYEVFASISPEKQVGLLKDTLAELPQIDESNAQLAEHYLRRDLKKIHELAEESFNEMQDQELAQHMREKLVRLRNIKMADRLQPRLSEGKTFVAVGALHLLGKNGVLELLERQGHAITV